MFRSVLVGLDGTPHGRDAIALATQLTAPDGAITLAHVLRGLLRLSAAVSLEPSIDDARASQQLLERESAAAGIAAELASVVGLSAGRGLHEEAERRGADLLVVGSSR